MKKITIIIPAYNEEESLPFLYERLEKLINSIDNYEFEILFVNDGSKDNTINLIKEYREKDPRISMYYRVLQMLTPVPIQKDTGDFRLLDRRCVNALKKLRETDRNSKSMFSWIGYKKKAVMYDRDARVAGKTKWNYKKLVNLAIDGITSFTTSPLRISTYIAIPTFLALFIYFIYVIIKCIRLNVAIQAFQAIILLVLFFSGVQILLFGIIGEYLGRIFNASKNRPLYLVNEYNGKREENE